MEKRRCRRPPYVKNKRVPPSSKIRHSKSGGVDAPLSRGLQVNDSALQSDCDGVRSVACAKFGKDVLDVALDRFLGYRESIVFQLVSIPAGNQTQHIDFS